MTSRKKILLSRLRNEDLRTKGNSGGCLGNFGEERQDGRSCAVWIRGNCSHGNIGSV